MMIKKFSNEELISKTHQAFKFERDAVLEVLRHLYEIESRKLYLDRAYPSLFEMCVKEFKCSNGDAHRKISAMRLLKEIPEVAPKVESGELSVTVLAQVQSFFAVEKKNERIYSKEEKYELLESLENKSTREVEKELASRNPSIEQFENLKPVSQTQMKLTVFLDYELVAVLDQLRSLTSHSNPSMAYEGVIRIIAEEALQKRLRKMMRVS